MGDVFTPNGPVQKIDVLLNDSDRLKRMRGCCISDNSILVWFDGESKPLQYEYNKKGLYTIRAIMKSDYENGIKHEPLFILHEE